MIFEEGPFPPGEESAEEPWDDVLIITPEDLADCLPPARHHLGTLPPPAPDPFPA